MNNFSTTIYFILILLKWNVYATFLWVLVTYINIFL